MGRCRNRRKYKRDNRNGHERKQNYKLTIRHNELFQKYYQGLGIVPEGEWDDFYETLKTSLPISFRFTGHKRQSKVLLNVIKTKYFEKILGAQCEDGRPVDPPKCLQWYPEEMAWQLNFTRKEVRSTPALEKLHSFLVSETESGNISRQEAVSMIPPVLLDIKPHHKVLDLCAAPGSKTAQLIEYLHAGDDTPVPKGFVVANDIDNKRCYMMVHQVKRLQSPCCIVVNHDAATMPNLKINSDNCRDLVSYDRVLADVPCSGDGTLRKNPDIWDTWHPAHGSSLHGLQSRILKRGLELLSVGGRLVYSTCSFNPAENEAVVTSMLQKCEGAIELVDVSDRLRALKSTPGLLTWKCMSRKGDWYSSYDEVPQHLQTQLKQSNFPPGEEITKKLKINLCLRVLPHHQNTGGFFIAVMVKKQQLPWLKTDDPINMDLLKRIDDTAPKPKDMTPQIEKKEEKPAEVSEVKSEQPAEEKNSTEKEENSLAGKRKVDNEDDNNQLSKKKSRTFGYKEDPFLFLKRTDDVWPPIQNFFKISDDFPAEQLMYRCETGKKRTLYFVSKAVLQVVRHNSERIKIINVGVKMFGRSPSPIVPDCDFRINQEGLMCLHHYFPTRRVDITKEDVITLLTQENPYLTNLGDVAFQQLSSFDPGSCIFTYKPTEKNPDPDCEMIFCGWKGKMSVRSFVGKHARSHYLRLCGVELENIQKTSTANKMVKEKDEGKDADDCIKMDSEEDGKDVDGCIKIDSDGEEENSQAKNHEESSTKSENCDAKQETAKEGDEPMK